VSVTVHVPKNLSGAIHSRTVEVGCGIGKRPSNLVSNDPEKVTCELCRQFAQEWYADRIQRNESVLLLDAAYFDERYSRASIQAEIDADRLALEGWQKRPERV
jgi:hypothetical protein